MQSKFGQLWREYEGTVTHTEIYDVRPNGPKGVIFTLEFMEGSMRGERVEVKVFDGPNYYGGVG